MSIFNNFLDKMFDNLKKKSLENDPELKKMKGELQQSINKFETAYDKWEKINKEDEKKENK